MKIFYGSKNVELLRNPVACIGIFDGIHLGHRKVIRRVLNYSPKERDRIIITFDPHPETVLRPEKELPRIMSLEHRISIFEKMGVDAVVVIHFSDYIAMMTPENFIEKEIKKMGVKTVYVGENFHFGRGKAGDVNSFREIGKRYGVDVRIVYSIKRRGKVISSTWLRNLISKGNLEIAEKLLRRPVSVYGEVVKGESRGRELGVPTANIDPHHEVSPPPGVYAVKVDFDGALYDGVVNIGFKPTFYGKNANERREPHVEVHLIGFSGDLYKKSLEIFFIKLLRKEKRFTDGDALLKQMRSDIQNAYKYLNRKNIITRIKKYKNLK